MSTLGNSTKSSFVQRLGMAAIAALALTLLLGVSLRYAGNAHASGSPSVVQSATVHDLSGSTGSSLSISLPSAGTSGDELLVLIGWAGGNDWSVSSVSDSQSNSFSVLAAKQADGINDAATIYGATLGASSGDSVSVSLTENCSGSCSSTFIQSVVTLVELSNQHSGELQDGGSGAYSVYLDNAGGAPGSHEQHIIPTTTDLPTTSTDIYVGLYVDGGADAGLSLPTGETQLGSKNDSTVNMEHNQAYVAGGNNLEFDSNPDARYAVSLAIAVAGS